MVRKLAAHLGTTLMIKSGQTSENRQLLPLVGR
jgi:hypothetical protein